MAILDADGYQDYPTAQILRHHVRSVVPTGASIAITTGGRNGYNKLVFTGGTNATPYVCRALKVPAAEIVVQIFIQPSTVPAGLRTGLIEFRDSSVSQVWIGLNSDGSLSALRHTSSSGADDFGGWPTMTSVTVLGTTAAGIVQAGHGVSLAVRLKVGDADGEVEIKANGVVVLATVTGDTRNGAATISSVLYGLKGGSGWSGATLSCEDLVVSTAFLSGDKRVDSLFPIADGTLTDWAKSTGADGYALIDEAAPNDDTDYVSTYAVNARSTFKVEAVKNPGAPLDAVMTVLEVRKEDAGDATVAPCIYGGAAAHDGTAQGLATSYGPLTEVFAEDPGTAAAWAEAAFGADGTAEFGAQKAS